MCFLDDLCWDFCLASCYLYSTVGLSTVDHFHDLFQVAKATPSFVGARPASC